MATIKGAVSARRAGGGEPGKGTVKPPVEGRTSPFDSAADIRDALGFLVGNNATDFKNDYAGAQMVRLNALLGPQKARKLATHAYLFNQRPGIAQMAPEERLRLFYEMGSRDPDVMSQLEQIRSLGQGPVAGFRTSVDLGNMNLTGRK